METTINLVHCQNIDLSFHRYTSSEVLENKGRENIFDFDFKPVYSPNDKRDFSILFTLNIDQFKEYKLSLAYIAWFKASKEIDQTLIKSGFTVINAPAIAFPYLRSFVTGFVVSAGYKPIFLPSINFTQTKQAKEISQINS